MKMVVLAKSDKKMDNGQKGYCVAGITDKGDWIRLVSDDSGDSLSRHDGIDFDCLDILEVETSACPIQYQPENAIHIKHEKISSLTIGQVVNKFGASDDKFLFVNNDYKLYDYQICQTDCSLMLVKVDDLEVYKGDNNKVKARFTYNGYQYTNISVTDPKRYYEEEYGKAYIVVSIPAKPFQIYGYFKFIAAIYPL